MTASQKHPQRQGGDAARCHRSIGVMEQDKPGLSGSLLAACLPFIASRRSSPGSSMVTAATCIAAASTQSWRDGGVLVKERTAVAPGNSSPAASELTTKLSHLSMTSSTPSPANSRCSSSRSSCTGDDSSVQTSCLPLCEVPALQQLPLMPPATLPQQMWSPPNSTQSQQLGPHQLCTPSCNPPTPAFLNTYACTPPAATVEEEARNVSYQRPPAHASMPASLPVAQAGSEVLLTSAVPCATPAASVSQQLPQLPKDAEQNALLSFCTLMNSDPSAHGCSQHSVSTLSSLCTVGEGDAQPSSALHGARGGTHVEVASEAAERAERAAYVQAAMQVVEVALAGRNDIPPSMHGTLRRAAERDAREAQRLRKLREAQAQSSGVASVTPVHSPLQSPIATMVMPLPAACPSSFMLMPATPGLAGQLVQSTTGHADAAHVPCSSPFAPAESVPPTGLAGAVDATPPSRPSTGRSSHRAANPLHRLHSQDSRELFKGAVQRLQSCLPILPPSAPAPEDALTAVRLFVRLPPAEVAESVADAGVADTSGSPSGPSPAIAQFVHKLDCQAAAAQATQVLALGLSTTLSASLCTASAMQLPALSALQTGLSSVHSVQSLAETMDSINGCLLASSCATPLALSASHPCLVLASQSYTSDGSAKLSAALKEVQSLHFNSWM